MRDGGKGKGAVSTAACEQPPSPPDACPAKLMLMAKKKCVAGQCGDSRCTPMPAVAAAVAPVATPAAASVVAPIAVSVGPQEVQRLQGGVELMASSYGPSRVKVGNHLTRTFDSRLEAMTFARMASAEIQKFSKMKRDRQTSYWANLQCVDRRFLRSSDTKDARMGFLHAALVNKQIPAWEVRYQAAVATARIQPGSSTRQLSHFLCRSRRQRRRQALRSQALRWQPQPPPHWQQWARPSWVRATMTVVTMPPVHPSRTGLASRRMHQRTGSHGRMSRTALRRCHAKYQPSLGKLPMPRRTAHCLCQRGRQTLW